MSKLQDVIKLSMLDFTSDMEMQLLSKFEATKPNEMISILDVRLEIQDYFRDLQEKLAK